jgi:hypothetical protein
MNIASEQMDHNIFFRCNQRPERSASAALRQLPLKYREKREAEGGLNLKQKGSTPWMQYFPAWRAAIAKNARNSTTNFAKKDPNLTKTQ